VKAFEKQITSKILYFNRNKLQYKLLKCINSNEILIICTRIELIDTLLGYIKKKKAITILKQTKVFKKYIICEIS